MINTGKSSKIAQNTSLLYLRMLFVMAINMWTVRLVLKGLGVENYGIYDVVAGMITMLQSLSSIIATSLQRFYSYEIGTNDLQKLGTIFSCGINTFFVISIFVFLLGEIFGIWFVNSHLNIPVEKLVEAKQLFHLSLLSLICLIFQTPFSSLVMANEDMFFFVVISMSECCLKFVLAITLSFWTSELLVFYGLGLLLISVFSLSSYMCVVNIKYKEVKYSLKEGNLHLYKDIVSFSGWIMISSLASLSINQICTLLVNVFFGPIVNAARAIAFQVNNILTSFCGSFLMAIKPPMIKAYAQNDYTFLNTIFNVSNKFIYYCLIIIGLPLCMEMDLLLKLWLNTNDIQAILFSRLMVVYVIMLALNNPITFIIQATGEIKKYYLLVEIPTVLCAPATFVAYKCGLPAYATYIILIVAIIISHFIRLVVLKQVYSNFNLRVYFTDFIIPAFIITIISSSIVYSIHDNINHSMIRLLATVLTSIILIILLVYVLGINRNERSVINKKITRLFKR